MSTQEAPALTDRDGVQFIVLEQKKHEPAREFAIRCLEHNIINLSLKPGQYISEQYVSEQIGMSRTPVREALFNLANRKIITIYPQKGSKITYIDCAHVEEARFTRWILECAVVEIAAKTHTDIDIARLETNLFQQNLAIERGDLRYLLELDNEFHEILFSIANMDMTFSFVKEIRIHFDRVRILNLLKMDVKRTIDEHTRLLELVKLKDASAATALMDKHLSHVIEDMPYLQLQYPDYFV